MDTADMIYRQWADDLQGKLGPEKMTKACRKFQKELSRTMVLNNARKDELWKILAECMQAASEFSFKAGLEAGINYRNNEGFPETQRAVPDGDGTFT